MTSSSLILARLAYLQAEIEAITALVRLQELTESGESPAIPPPAPAPRAPLEHQSAPAAPAPRRAPEPAPAKRSKRPAQFSYVPTATYRITGANPFRNGNNLALFNHLVSIYKDGPFTRTQLGEQIASLRAAGTIKSEMEEQPMVIGFLRFAGIEKGRIELLSSGADGDSAPAPQAAAKREAKVIRRRKSEDDLPEEA